MIKGQLYEFIWVGFEERLGEAGDEGEKIISLGQCYDVPAYRHQKTRCAAYHS